jgi:hypothetical protein
MASEADDGRRFNCVSCCVVGFAPLILAEEGKGPEVIETMERKFEAGQALDASCKMFVVHGRGSMQFNAPRRECFGCWSPGMNPTKRLLVAAMWNSTAPSMWKE